MEKDILVNIQIPLAYSSEDKGKLIDGPYIFALGLLVAKSDIWYNSGSPLYSFSIIKVWEWKKARVSHSSCYCWMACHKGCGR